MENKVQFYKNGELVGEDFSLRKEEIYLMGVSLYNEAEVEVKIGKEGIRYLPEDYRPYYDIYMDDKNN